MTDSVYKFTAYNSQAAYAYGSEAQADWFCERLNADREINLYGYAAMTADEITDENIERRDDVVNLDDAQADEAA